MNTYELLDELRKKSNEEIELALLTLMLEKKIDFVKLNEGYVKSLEIINDNKEDKLIESETCVMEGIINDKRANGAVCETSIQRRLYLLNESNRFNMKELNEKYKYDPERAKTYSWYYRKHSDYYGSTSNNFTGETTVK